MGRGADLFFGETFFLGDIEISILRIF